MTVYNFPLDLTKTYPILEDTEVVLSGDVSSNSVQDVLLNLLPEPSEIKDTPVSLKIVTVSITHGITYWDLIFKCPKGYDPTDLMEYIQKQATKIDNSFDHYYQPNLPRRYIGAAPTFCKVSFKVE